MSPLPPTRERPDVFVAPTPGGASPYPGAPKPPSRGRRVLKYVFFGFAILFAVLLGALVSTAFLAQKEVDKLLTPKTQAVRDAQKSLEPALPGKPANILIMGSDHRTGFADNDQRSDTLLMVRLDPKGESVSMLSFPRDLYVDIPGHGQSKINDAFSYGGPKLAVDTVKELTGLEVNFVMVVDFKGFRDIVDTLGGVYVDVDQRYLNDPENGGGNYAAIDIEPGYQLLGGRDALSYARFRHTDSDFHRIARQQQMLAALKKQVNASNVVRNLPGLVDVLNQNTDMTTGGNGKLGTKTVIDYLRLALKLRSKDVYQVDMELGIGTAGEASIVVNDEAEIERAVNAFLHPDRNAQAQTADQVTGTKSGAPAESAVESVPEPVPPGRIKVEVKNGNGVAGSAGETGAQLEALGYPVLVQTGAGGNADRSNYSSTVVQYRADRDQVIAEELAEQIDGATAEKFDGANPYTGRLLVIVGKTGGTVGAGEDEEGPTEVGDTVDSNKVPEKQAAKVVTDAEYGTAAFQEVADAVNIPVLYPTVRELSSTYATSDPVRAYRIAKGKSVYDAYRLVARTGSGDYWGLQGTAWPDPPILDDPTRSLTRGGREYQLYFNGTRLHMVAWREAGAWYWVSNSVLDKLGNETMLAIAQGVKRVPRG